jgi:hypothetical protein
MNKFWVAGEELLADDLNSAFSFGGDGADGILNVTSGTTTLDASGAKILELNYISINISVGATLTISNSHDEGTTLILKSQSTVTIAGAIDLVGFGAIAGTLNHSMPTENSHIGPTGNAGGNNSSGADKAGGTQYDLLTYFITGASGDINKRFLFVAPGVGGGTGGVGGTGTGGGIGGGGGGGASGGSFDTAGSTGGAGADYTSTATNGSAGGVGTGGGGGGGKGTGAANTGPQGSAGAGGNGGGALIIESTGTLTFTGTIDISGADGTDAVGATDTSHTSGGGGAGGNAGMALLLYNTIGTNTGTITASGGAGGDGAEAIPGQVGDPGTGGAAGTSSSNHYAIIKNTVF